MIFGIIVAAVLAGFLFVWIVLRRRMLAQQKYEETIRRLDQRARNRRLSENPDPDFDDTPWKEMK